MPVRFDAKLEQRLAELRAELLTELRRETAQLRVEFRTLLALAGLISTLR